ncbi:hypothetical protein M1555_01620 [Patescibacteria group bacterium]|nr:hypothetical protein [Patescibacteria group bacterium]
MAITRFETEAYITAKYEHPLALGDTECDLFKQSPLASYLPRAHRILIGGSGRGTEVYAFGMYFRRFAPVITAVDANVELDPDVKKRLKIPIFEERELLHIYLLQRPEPFDLVVINTGKSHGIETDEEYGALLSAIAPKGVLLLGVDVPLFDPIFSDYCDWMEDTEIPPLPEAWIKRE